MKDIEKRIQEEINPNMKVVKKGKKYALTLEGKTDILVNVNLKSNIQKWLDAAYNFNRAVLREKFNS